MSFGSIQLEFLICGINSEYVMISRLIEIYRANTISSSIFFAKDTQAPIFDITYLERDL